MENLYWSCMFFFLTPAPAAQAVLEALGKGAGVSSSF